MPDARSLRSRSELRVAQRWAVETLKRPWAIDEAERIPGIILAWDMGAGKTGAVLTAIRDLLDEFVIRKVLVVAGLFVAQVTWPDEFEEWSHTRAITYTVIRAEDYDQEIIDARAEAYQAARDLGMKAKAAEKEADAAVLEAKEQLRRRLAREDTEVHIINREALPWLWDYFGDGKRWPYDLIVIDDVRETKSGRKRVRRSKKEGKAPRSRFGVLARARRFVDATIQMTGTPAPNGLKNLWGQAYLVDLGERLGTSRTAFEQRWFDYNPYNYTLKPRASAQREITERLTDIMFSLDPKDYAEIPPVYSNSVKVRLPPRVLEEYRKFERTLVSEVYDVEAVSSGVLANKLLQFANGSMYQDDGNDVWIHDEKLDALETIIESANGEPVLVAYSFKFDLARIRKRYPKLVVFGEGNVRETKRRWNAGEIELMLGHPASIGHGQNIQFGGHISVWYGLTSDLELYQQFNKRLPRPGQTRPVFNHHIIAEDTHDEDMLPRLGDKAATQDFVLEATRVRLLNL